MKFNFDHADKAPEPYDYAGTLSSGAIADTRICPWDCKVTEVVIRGSDREMTDGEWNEYCSWLHTPDYSSTIQPL